MAQVELGFCTLCEAVCGLRFEREGDRITSIRGDDEDPFSRGHICPKGAALADLQADPDRLRQPLRRVGGRFEPISWEVALDEAGRRLADVRRRHGRDAVALYYGNPTGHSYAALLYLLVLARGMGTRNLYSANSVDALPRLLTSYLLYGSQAIIPIPDLDRTDFLLILGANPLVSNGSVMTAPDVRRRLRDIQGRGGRVVVVDPRRTRTAAAADRHLFIRPGTDALLLMAMLQVLFAEGRVRPGRLAGFVDGLAAFEGLSAPFTPERVAPVTGIGADDIRGLARDFAAAPRAACYGRMGTSVQTFGAVASWLVDVLNIATGNLDREGGVMFPTPAVDLAGLARRIGQTGSFDRWQSRVRGLPEFNGELPAATLADEIETPGPGQVRALLTHAGNPVLSVPNGPRLSRALAGLDFMVSIDFYLNETTRHAHLILPPPSPLERENYPLVFHALAVRNTAHFAPPVVPAPPGALHDWEILLGLGRRLAHHLGGGARLLSAALGGLGRALPPARALDLLLRVGPYRLTLDRLREAPHGLDLGPLQRRLPDLLATRGRRINLTPPRLVADVARLEARLAEGAAPLVLIGRRDLRTNNSWMHNSERLVRGPRRCTLRMHPEDAAARGVTDGEPVRVRSRVGDVVAPVQVTDEVMPGVVSLPHGWGHDAPGAALRVAARHPGVNVNALTDDAAVDPVSGVSVLNGVPVEVERLPAGRGAARDGRP